VVAPREGATARIGGEGMETKHSWLGWAGLVVPAFATALTWRLTGGLPYLNRVAVAVSAALVVYGVLHLLIKGLPRR
jgi:hypothetical protein